MSAPAGFQPLIRSSPLLDLLGPFHCRRDEGRALVVALRVEDKHCNHGGTAHGGLLSTLADVGLGYAMAFSREPPQPMVTAGLRVDFCGAARVGDWLEVHTEVEKIGQRLAFASARIRAGERLVATASGVFHLP
ncbi:esterase [Pseudomonas sp. A46]|uniref:PaaI family thioesterase n=1 Tax=Metapseudomonas furukawaii TaxID=1149133 RepID=UPI000B49B2C5|nr:MULTISPECIES: PaaI family thioesterase [Pseudomonas]OWJ92552.1 esterase [Pseudomonas sp. A46]WAG77669.1 PaaI family thioesterase [Pseudomonas furukawaii]